MLIQELVLESLDFFSLPVDFVLVVAGPALGFIRELFSAMMGLIELPTHIFELSHLGVVD